jgi:uncharacterized protein
MLVTTDPYARTATDRATVKTSFVSLEVSHDGRIWHTAGELRAPLASVDGARPAVLLVHGSAGVDSRAECYAAALNAAGIVTLEIDLWAARGVNSPLERPKVVAETLPDAFAALDYLTRRHDVDPERIGIMGFSWGGIVSMLSATESGRSIFARQGQKFAAHAPLYPVCWTYNLVPGFEFKELTGAPVFIQTGADDLYDDPDSCARFVEALPDATKKIVTYATYPGATHAWDRREADMVANDPFSHKGTGGEVPFRYNAEVARRSTEAIVEFFSRALRNDWQSPEPRSRRISMSNDTGSEDRYQPSLVEGRADQFVALTGCSGGGKSSLLAELGRRGFSTYEEPGRQIVKEQLFIGGDALPWCDSRMFLELTISRSIHHMITAARTSRLSFFDRGIIDQIGGFEPIPEHIAAAAHRFRYRKTVFFAPPWKEIFKNDEERRHSFEDAVENCATQRRDYERYGYEIVELPKITVAARADFILEKLDA